MFSLYTYYCLAFDSYKAWLYKRWYRSVLVSICIFSYQYFWINADELIGPDLGTWVNVGSALVFLALLPFLFLTMWAFLGRPIYRWNKDVETYNKWRLKK